MILRILPILAKCRRLLRRCEAAVPAGRGQATAARPAPDSAQASRTAFRKSFLRIDGCERAYCGGK